MIKKPRTIALGTVAIAAVILFATGPEVWSQAANAQIPTGPTPLGPQAETCKSPTPSGCLPEIVNKAILLFGVNLPFGRESPTFIQNVTQLAKMGFDSPENAKLFLRLDYELM